VPPGHDRVTTRELAIARSVVYASLFDYPLTLDQLHDALIESEQTRPEILAVYDGSALLQTIIEYREGFFFPAGRVDIVAERRRREARARVLLHDHARVLWLVCALPFTRLVALSGGIANPHPEAEEELDLFIVTKGRRVWLVTVAVLLLAKLLHGRDRLRTNVVLADTHLAVEPQDLFMASQILHLKPLIGADVLDTLVAANPFVTRCYPNRVSRRHQPGEGPVVRHGRGVTRIKALAELLLCAPSPLIEAACRRLYAWQARRRAGAWRSAERARLLHRFDGAVQQALDRAANPTGAREGATLTSGR